MSKPKRMTELSRGRCDEIAELRREVRTRKGENERLTNMIGRGVHAANHMCALRVKQPPYHKPAWSAVGMIFQVGSTTAAAMCREAGIDPYTGNDAARKDTPT